MTRINAKVVGNIPAHRLLWLHGNDEGDEMLIGLPKERGNYVDFVSTGDLEDGQEVTVNIVNNPIWTVEASTPIEVGTNVSANTDGRVGAYTSSPVRIGYSLDKAEPGELVRIVRNPKIYFHNLDLNELTNNELKEILDEQNIEYDSKATKKDLIKLLEK